MNVAARAKTRPPAAEASALRRFANASVVCEGWYPVARADRIGAGGVLAADVGGRGLVLWRDRDGVLRATDRACAHLGADLALGRVGAKGLQCSFHGWCWAADGACAAGGGVAAGRRTRAYATVERWGLAWVWPGGEPAYDLPAPEPENRTHVLRLRPRRIRCHPHVMLGNGLDLTHVGPVHGFRFEDDPRVEVDPPHRVSVDVHARFAPNLLRRVLGLAGRTARWRFTTIGPSLAWVRVEAPTPFELLWAGRPLADGTTATQTIFFLPRRSSLVRALPVMLHTTWADRRVLEGLDFRPGFVASDSVFASYAELVEEMPTW